MTYWLHWVGNAYYSIPEFIREAKKLGVCRRVPKRMLKSMNWGDTVFLASKTPEVKFPVIFGYFRIERICGVDYTEVPEDLKEKITMVSVGPPSADARGCGLQVSGGWYATTIAKLTELADYTEDPMISSSRGVTEVSNFAKLFYQHGGFFVFPQPYPELLNLKFFRGFRQFNGDKFFEQLGKYNGERRRLKDLFYIFKRG